MINNITNNEATAIKKFSKIMLRAVLVEDTWSVELINIDVTPDSTG